MTFTFQKFKPICPPSLLIQPRYNKAQKSMKLSIFSLKTEVQGILCNNTKWKKKLFEKKVIFCLNKGNIVHSFCSIWCTSYRNEIGKVFLIFIFEKFYQRNKVFCTNYEVEEILGLILGRFFLLTYLEWLLLLLSRHYIAWVPFLRGKNYQKLGHRVHHHNLDEV